jgi:hypothetical protein
MVPPNGAVSADDNSAALLVFRAGYDKKTDLKMQIYST